MCLLVVNSIEIVIYDVGNIIEKVNSSDVTFPDLAEDIANTNLKVDTKYIGKRLNLPKNRADILILASGESPPNYQMFH